MLRTPSFRQAFLYWLKLGFINFGGPAGQIALMHRDVVERFQWIDEESFLHGLNFCMLLPGPEAQQLATYIGWYMHGRKGAIVAGLFFILPSVFILLLLSYLYAAYGHTKLIGAIFAGFKPVVLAVVAEAAIKVSQKALKQNFHYLLAISAFIAIYFFNVSFLVVFLVALLTSFFISRPRVRFHKVTTSIKSSNIVYTSLSFIAIWLVPLLLLLLFRSSASLHFVQYLFFTKTAFITFGGAYAALSYVNQHAMEAGWISRTQAIDGLALAETTPGPLIMVLQFVAFMSAWNHPEGLNQIFSAVLAAVVTIYATFLPSFFFIFIAAPYVESLRSNQTLSFILSNITAIVVGAIVSLALTFGQTVLFINSSLSIFSLTLTIIAFLGLHKFKVEVVWIVLLGGICNAIKLLVE